MALLSQLCVLVDGKVEQRPVAVFGARDDGFELSSWDYDRGGRRGLNCHFFLSVGSHYALRGGDVLGCLLL